MARCNSRHSPPGWVSLAAGGGGPATLQISLSRQSTSVLSSRQALRELKNQHKYQRKSPILVLLQERHLGSASPLRDESLILRHNGRKDREGCTRIPISKPVLSISITCQSKGFESGTIVQQTRVCPIMHSGPNVPINASGKSSSSGPLLDLTKVAKSKQKMLISNKDSSRAELWKDCVPR